MVVNVVNTSNARFWRWYRTLPILLMTAMLVLSLTVGFLPLDIVRGLFFPVNYAERIDDAAARHNVDPHLVAAVIKCESGWNENAQSRAGAVGLMQVMPDTAKSVSETGAVDTKKYSPSNLTDPATNIEYGSALLSYLQENLSTTNEVIAAYNAGLSTVQGWLANSDTNNVVDEITYPETRHYVERVNEALRQYQQYYPDGMSTQ
ncbi:MAG: lytic transglycosylase domain-containing protein [Atopobiaceae bacterium]|nr:lytic transglycosylase domain-containing protein [Atopobiaceae bacterium]